jgi:fibrillarin-like rRNA methylase
MTIGIPSSPNRTVSVNGDHAMYDGAASGTPQKRHVSDTYRTPTGHEHEVAGVQRRPHRSAGDA